MWAAAEGHSNLGIPKKVGEEFVKADIPRRHDDDDDEGGHWVTIRGTHVHIDEDGNFDKGPPDLLKSLRSEGGERLYRGIPEGGEKANKAGFRWWTPDPKWAASYGEKVLTRERGDLNLLDLPLDAAEAVEAMREAGLDMEGAAPSEDRLKGEGDYEGEAPWQVHMLLSHAKYGPIISEELEKAGYHGVSHPDDVEGQGIGEAIALVEAPGTYSRADAARAGERTDYETAEAIRDGELSSPTKYGDFWLFDLRITGTGVAYRDSIDEWAIRDPKAWTSEEFVQRCNGLPVIFGHPERSGLNSEEFSQRAIGTIVLPYVKGDEVWGVAKIFDADAATLMQTTHRSTSPGVVPPKDANSIQLQDGTQVLAEDLPLVLDHLAVCEAGVWDKDGPPEGVRLDARERKDESVTEEERLKKERDDAMKERDDMKARLDAMMAEADAKKDASKKDDSKKDESDEEAMEKAERDDKKRKDAAKKDETEEEAEEATEKREKRREDKGRKDDAGAKTETVDADRGVEGKDKSGVMHYDSKRVTELEASHRKLEEEIARLRRAQEPLSIEDRNEIAKASHRADTIYQMLGEVTPQVMPGEKPIAFRKRLAHGLRPFTESWKNYAFHDAQQAQDFALVEDAIYGEAMAHAKRPIESKPGFLREIVTHPHGKTRTEFVGDHRAPWLPFTHPTKFAIAKINRPVGNVYGKA